MVSATFPTRRTAISSGRSFVSEELRTHAFVSIGENDMSNSKNKIKLFEEKQVRAVWDCDSEKWWFSIVDVVAVLTESPNPQTYWRVMKKRLKDEGNESVTNCNALKMIAADGKNRMTDVADAEQLLRLIQSVPSPKAEPFKLWLAKVGSERLDDSD